MSLQAVREDYALAIGRAIQTRDPGRATSGYLEREIERYRTYQSELGDRLMR